MDMNVNTEIAKKQTGGNSTFSQTNPAALRRCAMTATARNEASISAADLQESVGKLLEINLHLANLLSLVERKVQDEGETILHAARRYLNDEFAILKHLEGDDDWDQMPAPKILVPESEKGGA